MTGRPQFTIWTTKYALTAGIQKYQVEHCIDISVNMVSVIGHYHLSFHKEGKDWHRTRESALARAEEIRKNRIESLKTQIRKLEKLKFE